MNDDATEAPIQVQQWVLGGVLGLIGFIVFQFFGNSTRGYIDTSSTFYWWGYQWFLPNSEIDHGPLMMLLAGFPMWKKLSISTPANNIPRPKVGLAIMQVALIVHLLAYVVQTTLFSLPAILAYLIGMAYFLGGKRWGRASILPCFLMIFAMPLPFLGDFSAFNFYMRTWVIDVAHFLVSLLDYDVLRQGNSILSADGSYNYDVAPACSGIRSLLALSALSTIVGYLNFRNWLRWALLFALAFPFAFFGNVVRIMTIIIAAEIGGQDAGTKAHDIMGYVIFGIVLGLALLTSYLLERFLPEKEDRWPKPDESLAKQAGPKLFTITHGVAAVVLLGISTVSIGLVTHRLDNVSENYLCGVRLAANEIDPVPMPNFIGLDWFGQNYPVSEVERQVLPEDTGFSRKSYRNVMDGSSVATSIVLSGKDRSSIHRPELCLTGAGWKIVDSFKHTFEVKGASEGITTTVLRLQMEIPDGKGGIRPIESLFAYWFVSGTDMASTHWERRLQLMLDRLFRFRSHRWAYVFVQTQVFDGQMDKAIERAHEIIAGTTPEFQIVGFTNQNHPALAKPETSTKVLSDENG